LQWPVAADGTDEPLLYTKDFHFPDGKARLFPRCLFPNHATNRMKNLICTSTTAVSWNISTRANMTYRSDGIRKKTPDTFRRSFTRPRHGARHSKRKPGCNSFRAMAGSKVRAVVTDRVQGKELYMPMNSPKAR